MFVYLTLLLWRQHVNSRGLILRLLLRGSTGFAVLFAFFLRIFLLLVAFTLATSVSILSFARSAAFSTTFITCTDFTIIALSSTTTTSSFALAAWWWCIRNCLKKLNHFYIYHETFNDHHLFLEIRSVVAREIPFSTANNKYIQCSSLKKDFVYKKS